MIRWLAIVYPFVLLGMGLVTLITYWVDKRRSMRGRYRISEGYLHLMELAGGWIGGIFGRRLIRHKSRKLSFRFVSWIIVLIHLILVGLWLWYAWEKL